VSNKGDLGIEVLVADDEEDIRTIYKMAFEERGHKVTLTTDGEDCLMVYNKKMFQGVQEQQHHHHQQRQQQQEYHHNYHTYNNNLQERDSSSSSSLSLYSSTTAPPSSSPFEVAILDYRMPKRDGLQVAKEILKINPEQRIIFASAYVIETLEESVKQLKRAVEMIQKPFSISELIDIVENKEAYEGLKMLMTTSRDIIRDFDKPSDDQIRDLFEGLRKVQKFKGF
jgi:CheY-like chemotaxis protein